MFFIYHLLHENKMLLRLHNVSICHAPLPVNNWSLPRQGKKKKKNASIPNKMLLQMFSLGVFCERYQSPQSERLWCDTSSCLTARRTPRPRVSASVGVQRQTGGTTGQGRRARSSARPTTPNRPTSEQTQYPRRDRLFDDRLLNLLSPRTILFPWLHRWF